VQKYFLKSSVIYAYEFKTKRSRIRPLQTPIFKYAKYANAIMERADRVKGPLIVFLAIFSLYSALQIFSYLFLATYKLQDSYNIVKIIVYAIMMIPTLMFCYYFIKNNKLAKTWLSVSTISYIIGNVVLIFASNILNQGSKSIGPIRVEIFFILYVALYWFMMNSYFKTFSAKYV
jgi:hypothetical protein